MFSSRDRPTIIPGPSVHGPDVNTMTRAPCAVWHSDNIDVATEMAAPVALRGRMSFESDANASGCSSSTMRDNTGARP